MEKPFWPDFPIHFVKYEQFMSIRSASPGVIDHLQDLAENMIAEGFVKIDSETMAIVGCQAQTDPDTVDFDACARIILFNHVFQVVVEVELVVGKIGGAIHRAAVGNYYQYATFGIATQ